MNYDLAIVVLAIVAITAIGCNQPEMVKKLLNLLGELFDSKN